MATDKDSRRNFLLGAATAATAALAGQAIATRPAFAQASQPFLGEIVMVAFNFAPQGSELCRGQLLSIANNEVLYSVIGTTYGGDGVKTFALPNIPEERMVNFIIALQGVYPARS